MSSVIDPTSLLRIDDNWGPINSKRKTLRQALEDAAGAGGSPASGLGNSQEASDILPRQPADASIVGSSTGPSTAKSTLPTMSKPAPVDDTKFSSYQRTQDLQGNLDEASKPPGLFRKILQYALPAATMIGGAVSTALGMAGLGAEEGLQQQNRR